MANKINEKLAKLTYKTLLGALKTNGWNCKQNDEKRTVEYGVNGDDLHMDFTIRIDAERQLVRLHSKMPYRFPMNKIEEAALAVCSANYALACGSFDLNLQNGEVLFRLTASYRETKISEEVLLFLLNYGAWAVDKFNDKLLMVSNGTLTAQEFHEKFSEN
ncbi:MAG: YbjN domain-containing protein [Corallococcus sp.]|nr:YbjN domain-containing protein [Corallococcus sp.]MCM1358918.1 YbjN domain-containing protein [Corallococcus sp.]MCM1394906.1 YbjN domain-containing protein [Corallococcus sp.]